MPDSYNLKRCMDHADSSIRFVELLKMMIERRVPPDKSIDELVDGIALELELLKGKLLKEQHGNCN